MEEEEAAEEAEQVGGEQREVDDHGAGELHHRGHEAVQGVHAQGVGHEQQNCGRNATRLPVTPGTGQYAQCFAAFFFASLPSRRYRSCDGEPYQIGSLDFETSAISARSILDSRVGGPPPSKINRAKGTRCWLTT